MKNKFIHNIIYISVWSCWVAFLVLVSYKTRFWINDDTIGSLDIARYLINSDFLKAVNSYWGSGYGIFLSLLPLDNFNSWFSIHLFISLLVVVSQLFIYWSLRLSNIAKSYSTLIVFFWGISHFVTGGAFFITADVPLCFLASFYIFIASNSKTDNNISQSSRALLLGILHGLASITKAIAFYGLMVYPILLFSRNLTYVEKGTIFKRSTFFFVIYCPLY